MSEESGERAESTAGERAAGGRIRVGMPVYTAGGDLMGAVEALLEDGLRVGRWRIPARAVERVEDGRVYLFEWWTPDQDAPQSAGSAVPDDLGSTPFAPPGGGPSAGTSAGPGPAPGAHTAPPPPSASGWWQRLSGLLRPSAPGSATANGGSHPAEAVAANGGPSGAGAVEANGGPPPPGPPPPTAESATGPAAPAGSRTVSRTASAEFPPLVEAGSEAVLSYAIDHQAVLEHSAPLTLSVPQEVTEVPLVVAVHAGPFRVYDFESGEARNFHRVTLRLDAPAPLAGQFLLRAPETAAELATEVDVRFLHQGLPVGEVSLPTAIAPRPGAPASDTALGSPASGSPGVSAAGGSREVVATPLTLASGAPARAREAGPSGGVGGIAISFAAAPPPDLVLRVREAGAGRYELNVDRDGGSGARFYDRPLGEFPVTDRAATYTEGVLETLRDARRLLPEVRIPRVEGVGRALWRNLPQDFRDFYWAEMHGRELSIAIYSDEPYVPWELIVPEGPDGAAAPMLGVAFSVARWKRARFFPDPLRVAGFAVVVPAYAATPLPYAEEEAGELQRDFGARRVPGEYAAVVQLLRSRGLQAIHFAGHGRFDPGAADASELLLADAPLRPTDVAGATIGQAERPLVFVNACEVGQQEWALTQIGGWAEAFCAAGCTAFVGPYWPVEDRVAARAARVFYEALRAGETVGQAMQAVRRRFQTDTEFPAHPTWLAYTLHCQPNVTVEFVPPPGP